MSELDILRELTGQLIPPTYDDLVAVARKRRRRAALAAGAAAACAVSAVVVATVVATGVQRGAPPSPVAPEPSVTASSTPARTGPGSVTRRFPAMTPTEIRNHPDASAASAQVPVTGAPGVDARIWSVCLDVCAPGDETPWLDGSLQQALEVTDDDFRSGALHAYPARSSISHAIDDIFYVYGTRPVLVDSTGQLQVLTQGATLPATDIAGPMVATPQGHGWIDLVALQVHAIENDEGAWDWWGAEDTWFWGNVYHESEDGRITHQGLTWRNPDGTFGTKMLPIDFAGHTTQMLRDGTSGTMAAVDPGPPRLLHVSTDYGQTWHVRVVPVNELAGPGLPDDWESWPRP